MTDRAMFLAQRETQGVPRDVAQAEWDTRQGELIAQLVAALEGAKELAGLAETMTASRSDDEYVWGLQTGFDAALAAAKAAGYGGKDE